MKAKRGRPITNKITVNKQHFMKVLRSKNTSIRKLGSKKPNGEFEICNERTIRLGLQKGQMNSAIMKKIAMKLDVDPKYLSGEIIDQYGSINDQDARESLLSNYANKHYPHLIEQWANTMHNSQELIYGLLPLYDITKEQYIALSKEDKYQFVDDILQAIRPLIQKYFSVDADGKPVYSGMMYADFYVHDWKQLDEDEEIIKGLKDEWRDKILPEKIIFDYDRKKIKDFSDEEIIDMFYMGYFNDSKQ